MWSDRSLKRAVVWDVDGTLIDSEPLHFEALAKVCERYGCRIDAEENTRMLGLSIVAVFDRLAARHTFPLSRERWMGEVLDYYVGHVHGGLVRPGVHQAVAALARRGITQACVSTAERRVLLANLGALDVTRYMACIIGREDVTRTKPDPEPYALAAARLGLPPSQCLAVEDTQVGVASARAAGFTVLAWPNALSQGLDFSAADAVLSSLEDFPWEALAVPLRAAS